MEAFFWGVRGSIATPGSETTYFGGNTACVEIRHGDDFIIVDAGTGIRVCGNHILKNRGMKNDIKILITHTHWDHIQGFPFFAPAFIPGNMIEIIGPAQYDASFEDLLSKQMQYSYFPVNYSQLGADLYHRDIMEGTIEVNGFKVTAKAVNHPVRTLAYRFERAGQVIVLVSDSEPYYDMIFHGVAPEDEEEMAEFDEVQKTVAEENQKMIDFCADADILIHDAQYTLAEYPSKKGWGHTPMDMVVEVAKKAKAKNVLFFHHDPTRTDEELKRLVGHFQNELSNCSGALKSLEAARELTSVKCQQPLTASNSFQ